MLNSIEQFSMEFSPTHALLNLISEIDEYKCKWTALQNLSRVLTTLLLLHFGYEYVSYISLESIVEDNKNHVTKYCGRHRKLCGKRNRIGENGVLFFLKCLKKHKDKLAAKLERESILAQTLTALSNEILKLLREQESLAIAEIETLTKANRNTLKVRLRELARDNFIEQNGQARSTFYRLKAG